MKNISDFLKKNDIIRVSPNATLSEALGQLSSSHDAAFVVDEKDNFLGVVSPYYALIKSSAYDGNTKIENSLYHPPKIHAQDTLGRIAQMMCDSRIHYLPVFDEKEEFVGITSARRILRLMKDVMEKTFIRQVLESKEHPLVTIDGEDTVAKAIRKFKDLKISKLVVIDKNMKLVGVLSYYDLIPNMIAPGKRKKGGRGSDEQEPFSKLKVKNYSKKSLLTLKAENTIAEAITMMLEHEKGSVVIVDSSDHPIGIVTTKDILRLMKTDEDQKPVQLTAKNFNEAHMSVITDLVDYVFEHIQKDSNIKSAEIVADEEKKGVLYRIAIYITPVKGKMTVYEREGKDLPGMLRELKNLVRQEK